MVSFFCRYGFHPVKIGDRDWKLEFKQIAFISNFAVLLSNLKNLFLLFVLILNFLFIE